MIKKYLVCTAVLLSLLCTPINSYAQEGYTDNVITVEEETEQTCTKTVTINDSEYELLWTLSGNAMSC